MCWMHGTGSDKDALSLKQVQLFQWKGICSNWNWLIQFLDLSNVTEIDGKYALCGLVYVGPTVLDSSHRPGYVAGGRLKHYKLMVLVSIDQFIWKVFWRSRHDDSPLCHNF